jgi:hypothetical protein
VVGVWLADPLLGTARAWRRLAGGRELLPDNETRLQELEREFALSRDDPYEVLAYIGGLPGRSSVRAAARAAEIASGRSPTPSRWTRRRWQCYSGRCPFRRHSHHLAHLLALGHHPPLCLNNLSRPVERAGHIGAIRPRQPLFQRLIPTHSDVFCREEFSSIVSNSRFRKNGTDHGLKGGWSEESFLAEVGLPSRVISSTKTPNPYCDLTPAD